MNRKVVSKIIVATLIFALALAGLITPKVVNAQQIEEPLNTIILDVTYNPEEGTYSLGGLSAEQLKILGAPEMTSAAWNIASRFDNVTVALEANKELNLTTEGEKLASINWDETSRQALYELAKRYVSLEGFSVERAEEWVSNSNIVLNIRNNPELSNPLQINLATLLQVDINSDRVFVEGFDTGVMLQGSSSVVQTGGINNTTMCWDKGQIYTKVEGKDLPDITIYQGGLDIINNALGLGLGSTPPLFDAKIGVDVSFEGAPHSGIYCEK